MDAGVIIPVMVELLFIMNPFASIPMFMGIAHGADEKTIRSYCNKAVLVAAILLYVFIIAGKPLMDLMGISMPSFRVAGGLVLLLMGVELIFNLKMGNNSDGNDAPWILIATPILTGPGVITASILFTSEYGYVETIIGGAIALLITWVLLRLAPVIMKAVGEKSLDIVARVVGLLIAALGVEYMFAGAWSWVDHAETLAGIASVLVGF